MKSESRDQLVGFEARSACRVRDFNRTKNRMGHERRKTTVSTLQRHLQHILVESARTETMLLRDARNRALDVCKQLRVRREWTDLERALPRADEVLGRNLLAVGPARIVA